MGAECELVKGGLARSNDLCVLLNLQSAGLTVVDCECEWDRECVVRELDLLRFAPVFVVVVGPCGTGCCGVCGGDAGGEGNWSEADLSDDPVLLRRLPVAVGTASATRW